MALIPKKEKEAKDEWTSIALRRVQLLSSFETLSADSDLNQDSSSNGAEPSLPFMVATSN